MTTTAFNGKGALPEQVLLDLMRAGFITGGIEKNVKPSSLDLSVSSEIYEVEGLFQPKKNETVRDVLSMIKKKKHSLDKPLLRDKVYLARLNESLSLPESVYGFCNPKSTSGRIDVHVRLLSDFTPRYDSINPGAKTELWISIMPKSFSVKLYEGVTLNQLRFFNMDTRLNKLELEIALRRYELLWKREDETSYTSQDIQISDKDDNSFILTLDLSGKNLGYEGIKTDKVLDLSKVNFYKYQDFFKPIKQKGGFAHLKKGSFYILSTHEAVRIPPDLACEMVPVDERSGDFRSHYAGFIDPGWGWGADGEGKGRPFTLEVRPFEDIVVRQGQPIAKIRFEKMSQLPNSTYDTIGSNYVVQTGPRLAKHFK